ncbi:MAG: hypothetical protein ACI9P7_002460, partial [Candidatus Azotimanducaceae bacterium]
LYLFFGLLRFWHDFLYIAPKTSSCSIDVFGCIYSGG